MISAVLIDEFEEWMRVQGGRRNTHQDVSGHPHYRRRGGFGNIEAVCIQVANKKQMDFAILNISTRSKSVFSM